MSTSLPAAHDLDSGARQGPRATGSWPTVSVVVPVRNGGAALRRLAVSLVSQQYPGPSPEIFVVDNGSTDGALSAIADLPLTILVEPRPGPAAARNCGAREGRGEILAFIDADCQADRRWLMRLAEAFSDPQVHAAAGETLPAPGTTPAQLYAARVGHNSAAISLKRPIFPFTSSGNMAVRRSTFEGVGGFDEDFLTAEDVDLCHRLRLATGAPIRFVPAAIVLHENRATGRDLFHQNLGYGRGWARLLLRHRDELCWTPGLGMRANWDVVRAASKVPGGLWRWRVQGGHPMEFYFPWFDLLRRMGHRVGFVQETWARGHPRW